MVLLSNTKLVRGKPGHECKHGHLPSRDGMTKQTSVVVSTPPLQIHQMWRILHPRAPHRQKQVLKRQRTHTHKHKQTWGLDELSEMFPDRSQTRTATICKASNWEFDKTLDCLLSRGDIVSSCMCAILQKESYEATVPIAVIFEDEPAIDGGGPRRVLYVCPEWAFWDSLCRTQSAFSASSRPLDLGYRIVGNFGGWKIGLVLFMQV